ncbi:MAG: MFS transporter, partial [Chloroflexota bacterium]
DKRVLMALAFLLQIIGGLSLIAANFEVMGFNIGPWSLPVFAIAFGLGFGGSIPVRLSMIADYFGRRSYGSMLGLVSTVNQGLAAISPVAVGAAFDITGTYRLPMLVLAAILCLSIPMMLLLEEPARVTAIFRLSRQRRRAADAAARLSGDGD